MLVTRANFDAALSAIVRQANDEGFLGFDTETTCLNWWSSPWHSITPRVFAMQFATERDELYFDWNYSDDKLGERHFDILNRELFSNPEIMWFIQNAKFDMHHAANHGIEFKGLVHCTKAIARVMSNCEPALGLDALGNKYLGEGKHLDMAAICKEKGFVTKVKKFGFNDKYDEILHFDRIDAETMITYGKIDTRRCYDLGIYQLKTLKELDEKHFADKKIRIGAVMANEHKLTKVLFEMEREGVLIDRAYTEEAYNNEVQSYCIIESELDALAKKTMPDKLDWNSAKQLKPLFDALGEPYKYTEKGNASFDRDALEESDSELAKLILAYRHHYKRAHTYFENFIWLADTENVLHADAQQAGTITGRMSYWTPNLQNVPKRRDKDEAKYKVRRCFIPKPGTFFADFDYSAAEYAMMLDYAREMTLVEKVKQGEDVHEATRIELNLATRDEAKTMNFGLLYGMGYAKFAKDLKCSIPEAKRRKNEYFARLPAVGAFINSVKHAATVRGYVFNWAGRLLYYDNTTNYKAPNGLIQGGVGDMCKFAMTKLAESIHLNFGARMILQVHDSLLWEIPFSEQALIPKIIEIMEKSYPHKVLPMKVEAEFSDKCWSSLQGDIPSIA